MSCMRLGRFPLRPVYLSYRVPENERSLFVADNNVRVLLITAGSGHDLCANTGIVVNQMRNEFHRLIRLANQLKPI